jgi:hypothetical protein
MDKILELLGLKWEDLNTAERETLMSWVKAANSKQVGRNEIKEYVQRLRMDVDNQLATEKLNKKQDLFLKARLKNLILLEAFMIGPEQAKKSLEMYAQNLRR